MKVVGRGFRWSAVMLGVVLVSGGIVARAQEPRKDAPKPEAAKPEGPKPEGQKKEEPKKEKVGDIEVTVVVADGKPLKSLAIYAKNQTAKAAAVGAPTRLVGVLVGRTAVTVEAQVKVGKGTKRYLGVVETYVKEKDPARVTVTVTPVPQIDPFCLGCHPNPRDPDVRPEPGQLARDIHYSGREFPEKNRPRYMGQVKAHNDTVAMLEKEGKPHYYAVPLEERIVKVKGKEVKKLFYTCESCHTFHETTPWTRYARAPFRETGALCVACHF